MELEPVQKNVGVSGKERNLAIAKGKCALSIFFLATVSIIAVISHDYIQSNERMKENLERYSDIRGVALYSALLFVGMLLPVSPSGPLVGLGIVVFGPVYTFIISYVTGIAASCTTYGVGKLMSEYLGARFGVKDGRFYERLISGKSAFGLVLCARLIPNPLYDMVGYIAGIAGVRFVTYLLASMIGGGTLLAFVCFVGEIVTT